MNSANSLLFDNLLTAKDVGAMLGVHHKTVYEWVKQKESRLSESDDLSGFDAPELAEWLRKKGGHYGKEIEAPN